MYLYISQYIYIYTPQMYVIHTRENIEETDRVTETSQVKSKAGSCLPEWKSPAWLVPCLELRPKLHKAGREANGIFP